MEAFVPQNSSSVNTCRVGKLVENMHQQRLLPSLITNGSCPREEVSARCLVCLGLGGNQVSTITCKMVKRLRLVSRQF